MNLDITIQPIGNAYSRQAIDLILPIQQIETGVPVTLEDQPDLLDIDGFYYGSGGGFWGALLGEQLVGTIALIAIEKHGGVIRKMFVHKDYRGRELGIAQHLLETLKVHCDDRGITDLYLGTRDNLKAAIRFYERNGFHQLPKNSLPSSFPIMKVDNVFFHLQLDKTPQ